MESSKRCVILVSLIFIIRCLTKSNLNVIIIIIIIVIIIIMMMMMVVIMIIIMAVLFL